MLFPAYRISERVLGFSLNIYEQNLYCDMNKLSFAIKDIFRPKGVVVAMFKWWKNWSFASWKERMRQFMAVRDFRGGKLVGMDKAGNKYYEIVDESRMLPCTCTCSCSLTNPFIVRSRFVEYASGRRRDTSQIPAEW